MINAIGDAAVQLQNCYAYAIDTRNWDRFRDVFAPDVRADYPTASYDGIDEWLSEFIPFHDACRWTLHTMTNHVHGHDGHGVWAVCYGFVEWIHDDRPDHLSRWNVRYEDRLREFDGGWRISHRAMRVVRTQTVSPIPGRVHT